MKEEERTYTFLAPRFVQSHVTFDSDIHTKETYQPKTAVFELDPNLFALLFKLCEKVQTLESDVDLLWEQDE